MTTKNLAIQVTLKKQHIVIVKIIVSVKMKNEYKRKVKIRFRKRQRPDHDRVYGAQIQNALALQAFKTRLMIHSVVVVHSSVG